MHIRMAEDSGDVRSELNDRKESAARVSMLSYGAYRFQTSYRYTQRSFARYNE